MAVRNVSRNRRRSVMTVLAVAFATTLLIFMLSWQLGSYATMIDATVRFQSGHLQIQARGYRERMEVFRVVPSPGRLLPLVESLPGYRASTFRGNAFALVSASERTYGCAVIGVDPAREGTVSPLPTLVREGEFLRSGSAPEALVGALLAKNLRVGVGDELILLGQGRDGSVAATAVTVRGIFRSGQDSFDRSTLILPLRFFQETFSMGDSVHQVIILLDSLSVVKEAKKRLQGELSRLQGGEKLVVLDWIELLPGLVDAIKMDLSSGFIFYIILIVVVAFSIMNTFLMAVFERKKEFGILVAVGVRPGRLAKVLLLESFTITGLGVLLGILMGSAVTLYFQSRGIEIRGAAELLRQFGLPTRMYPRLSPVSVAVGSGLVFLITFITALYPAGLAMKIKPVEAMGKGF
ncbi:MAG: ABC transporter permease [Deltaproteobacteria bacterium]|nr:MAG: ABC transporter permease [Deltaproteobacteria bacterium]